MPRIRRPHLVVAVALAFAPALAQAQLPDNALTLTAGWFLQSADADVRVDGNLRGTDINLGDLGLDSSDSSFIVGGVWRFAERHRLGLYSFNIKRDASRTLSRTITIGDNTYPVGVSLASDFRTQVTPITYMWSFMKDRDSELALTVGVHWSKIELGVTGSTSLGGTVTRNTSAKVDAPLPLVGLRWDQALGKDWLINAGAEYFAVKAGDVDGSFGTFHISGEYAFAKNWAVGANYTYFTLRADSSSSSWKGRVEYDYSGPALYISARF